VRAALDRVDVVDEGEDGFVESVVVLKGELDLVDPLGISSDGCSRRT